MGLEDDVVYLKILIFTFIASYFIKRVPCKYRDAISSILGLITIYVVCGRQLLYSLPMVAVNIILIKFCSPKPFVNFLFCFGYLTFFRCAHLLCGGDLYPKYLPHANAVQLIMTLRCVGLAFELDDQRQNAKARRSSEDKATGERGNVRDELSSDWAQLFFYCYNLVGLFTGPYYSYRVHQDMVRCKFPLRIPFSSEVINRLLPVPFLIGFFLILQAICPVEEAHKDSFYESSTFLKILFYSVPVFAYTRMRCYIAWMLSESACMVAGIGAYPKLSKPKVGLGPTDLEAYDTIVEQYEKEGLNEVKAGEELRPTIEYDYETINNIDAYGCEFSHTFRDSMRCWNRSVQYWLVTYVYRRCPWKSMRTSVTMLVSAYWHGVHAGYYLSFMTIPLCLLAEDLAFSVMEKRDQQGKLVEKKKEAFRLLWWFFRMRGFEYMVMGFLLLSFESTTRYWASTFYSLHSALLIIIIGFGIKKYFIGSTKEKVQ